MKIPLKRLLHLTRLKNRLTMLIFALLAFSGVNGQNITGVEYFFDADPGFGNGISYTVAPAPNITNISISAGISALSDGFHIFFVRAKDDSGRWGHTNPHPFYKVSLPPSTPDLVKVEYFFNNDPGFGNGTDVPVTPTQNLSNFSFAADITTLPEGFHFLFVRVKDANGQWSTTNFSSFVKSSIIPTLPDIVAAEYFIDSDPGFGNGTVVPLTPATNITDLNFTVDISSITAGFHQLMVRVRDAEGRWSTTLNQSFIKSPVPPALPDIVKAEYFIDNDPGFGSGTDIPLTPAANITGLNFTVDLSGITAGFHELMVRVRDAYGRWSTTLNQSFVKSPVPPALLDIVKAEYFIDNDPGFGNGTDIPLTPATNITGLNFSIDINPLNSGFHNLFVRVMDADGRWSTAYLHPFYKEVINLVVPNLTAVEYFFDSDPGYGNGTAVNITPGPNKTVSWAVGIGALSNGFHKLLIRVKDSTGRWSLTEMHPFYKETLPPLPAKITRVEYFIDTDPGFGLATEVALPADTNNISMAWDIDIQSLSQGFHKLFVRAKDARGKWSLTSFQPFYKQLFYDTLPDIVKLEYFYDNDPGFGNGINVPVTPSPTIPFLAWSLNLSGVPFGQHQLFVRVKDEYGKWSLASHDTIFYYLDSLPTASLSGPVGVCIYQPATFDVTLTGTAPWTVIYNDGFQVDTATNIMSSPFSFDVVPQQSGTFEAKVMKVQDAYYTGLYTGIPIEYQVYPLPGPIPQIYGPTHICEGMHSVQFWVYWPANTTHFVWTVPAGASISGSPNNNVIYVDFGENAQSGLVTVKAANNCGYNTLTTLEVTIHELPTVSLGPDISIGYDDSTQLHAVIEGGSSPYTYSWYPWWLLNNSSIADPWAYPTSTTTFTVTVNDVFGCSATDDIVVTVGPPSGTTISGTLRYDNTSQTPLTYSTVYLKQGNIIVAQAETYGTGTFSFPYVQAGNYTLTASSNKEWAGVNSADGFLILKHFANIAPFTGLRLAAADVNGVGNVNAVDALLCGQRFVGVINSFAAGDWVFEQIPIYVPGTGTMTQDILGLCTGDVNGSNNPVKRPQSSVTLDNAVTMSASPSGEMDLPVIAQQTIDAYSFSLVLEIPSGYQVSGINMKNGNAANLLYHVNGNELRIVWFDLMPVQHRPGDEIISLHISYLNPVHGTWNISGESSFHDGNGEVIGDVHIMIPKLTPGGAGFVLGDNYPNPFRLSTNISFVLPADGTVKISVLNLLGREILVLADAEMKSGLHEIVLEGNDIAPGIYHYRIIAEAAGKRFEQTKKLIRVR